EGQTSGVEDDLRRPEFASALKGDVSSDTRTSRTLGISFLYVAAPIAGGAVRLAYPLSDLETARASVGRTMLLGSAMAVLVALAVAAIAARTTARRLQHIVEFANRIATGDLGARIAETSGDEVGKVAAALDRTARHLEESFAALQTNQRQLETLLNS